MDIRINVESPSHVMFSVRRLECFGPAGQASSLAVSVMVCRAYQNGNRIPSRGFFKLGAEDFLAWLYSSFPS